MPKPTKINEKGRRHFGIQLVPKARKREKDEDEKPAEDCKNDAMPEDQEEVATTPSEMEETQQEAADEIREEDSEMTAEDDTEEVEDDAAGIDPDDEGDMEEDDDTLRMSVSSDRPCDMGYFREILDHDGINMERMEQGLSVLWNHNSDQLIGRASNPEVKNGKLYVDVKFSRNEQGQAVKKDVMDGILTDVSIGYSRESMQLEASDEKGDTYRATAWTPLEISFAPVPADHTVGVGRSKQTKGNVTVTRNFMPEPTNANAIRDWCKLVKTHEKNAPRDLDEQASRAIALGLDLPAFRNTMLPQIFKSPGSINPNVGLSSAETQRFSITKAIREVASGKGMSGLEKEACTEAANKLPEGKRDLNHLQMVVPFEVRARHAARTQTTTPNTAGGYLVAQTTEAPIELLLAQTVLGRAGATSITGLVGNVVFPVHTSGPTAYWVAEDGSITAADTVWGAKTGTPKQVAARTSLTHQMMAQASIAMDSYVMQEQDRRINLAVDLAGLQGTGIGGEPLGIQNTTGINAGVTFGGAPTWADVVQFETDLTTDNALLANPHFIVSPATAGKWKVTVQAATFPIYLMQPPLVNDGVMAGTSNGYPALRTSQIAGDRVFFGCFSELLMLSWASRILTIDPFSSAANGRINITVLEFVDFVVRQPTAFSVSTDSGAQ